MCFTCSKFENDGSFVFTSWKETEKRSKHGQSGKHITAMTKWTLFMASQKRDTSVLEKLNSAHKQQVKGNRQYLQVIIECLMYSAQQNIALRGHVVDRRRIWRYQM